MAFQWIFDTAESIAVNTREVVGQTITRNQTVRAVSRGNSVRIFTVKLPDGLPWDDYADDIQALDAADKFTVESIAINNPGYNDWMYNGDIDGTSYNVIAVQLPTWNIFSRNQVAWSGEFIFYESIV